MLPKYENLLTSSFLLYLDNRLLTQCSGFYNTSTLFYPITQTFNGYYTYSAPFKPLVGDTSVPIANIMTGVYLNGNFITIGQSGLVNIDYTNGNLYFLNQLPSNSVISGMYSFNEAAIVLPSFSDITVLFETKLSIRPKVPQIPTGLFNNQLSYPAIFIKNEVGSNTPWAFGGLKNTTSEINAYIFAESQFQLDAIVSNFKDAYQEYVPLLGIDEFPYNNMGGFKNGIPYNYTGISSKKIQNGSGAFISDVTITDWGRRGLSSDIAKMTTEAFFSLATFTIEKVRLTH